MEIKDIVVEADMDVRGGAAAANYIGGFEFVQTADQSNGGYRSQSTGTSQTLNQSGLFAPVVSQHADARASLTHTTAIDLKNVNVQLGGFFGPWVS